MRTTRLWLGALAMLCVSSVYAQNIAGDWQGTLKAGSQELRIVIQIAKTDDGGWSARMFSIDQGPDPMPASSVSLQGSELKLTVDAVHGSYQGTLSADGASMKGAWTQGRPAPLELVRATKDTAWPLDTSPHTTKTITVDGIVKLEALDWGGTGRPLVLLAGLGNTAHVFDTFALKLTGGHHVYGITRRGFGASSTPAPSNGNYSADRLGDDVLAVIDALNLDRPVLVGHSIAGEELSSVGSRRPEKVAGLIYLDAGYSYAYYDSARGDYLIDSLELRRKLKLLVPGGPQDQKKLIEELLQTTLPQFERDLKEQQKQLQAMPAPPQSSTQPAWLNIAQAIIEGERKYTDIRPPALVIYAVPHDLGPAVKNDPAARAAAEARELVSVEAQAKAFETGVPSARVVRLPHANHFVFRSNEADVLREMQAFFGRL